MPDNLQDTIQETLDSYLDQLDDTEDVDTADLSENLVRRVLEWLDNPLNRDQAKGVRRG